MINLWGFIKNLISRLAHFLKEWNSVLTLLVAIIIASFLIPPTLSVKFDSYFAYFDVAQAIPHYEFSSEDAIYIRRIEANYKVIPPFYSTRFNSEQTIEMPIFSVVEDYSSYPSGCVNVWQPETSWPPPIIEEISIYTSQSYFRFKECLVKIWLTKKYQKNDLVLEIYNVSRKQGWEGNRFYEEEGIRLGYRWLRLDPIKNYVFIYNQSESFQIKKRFPECEEIKVFLDEKEYPFRYNFANNSSIIALKMDFEPRETKGLIIRCYH